MVKFCWHGVASYSLNIDGVELSVDPFFADDQGFNFWFKENQHKPSFEQYFQLVNPEFIVITHGHFDHCCLHTLRVITEKKSVQLIAGRKVLAALHTFDAVHPQTKMIEAKLNEDIRLGSLNLRSLKAIHWQQGIWGNFISAQYANNRHWGPPPVIAGGTPLSYLLSNEDKKIYLSGDNKLPAIPNFKVDLAFINIGTYLFHPFFGVPVEPLITLKEVPQVIERLKCRIVVLLHYDWDNFLKPLLPEEIEDYLTKVVADCRIVVPKPNCWLELD